MSRKPIAEIRKEIAQFRARANKAAKGSPVVSSIEDVPNTYFLRRPSGIMQLDIDTGGGLPAGGLSYLSGPDNCLDGDTWIPCSQDGKPSRPVTLRDLFARQAEATYQAFSIDDVKVTGSRFMNKVLHVVSTGNKECFFVETQRGHSITATGLHKFFDGKEYRQLETLKVGDQIYTYAEDLFLAAPDTITRISPAGLRDTYDLKMAAPFHNYVANNFVVHNSGKSYLLAKYFAMNQRLYGEKSSLAIGLSEGAPDHWFWRKAGVQVAIPDAMIEEEMKYRKERNLKPFTKEEHKDLKKQVGEIVVLRHATGEKLLQTVIEAIETGVFDFVGLDSVSALLSESESGKELDENPQQAAVATSMTRFFQHYLTSTTGFYGRNDTTVVFTAQARSNRKKSEAAAHFAKYMKDWTTSGSWAARHGKLIDITVWSGGKEKEEVLINGKKQRVAMGKDICWEISKGKAGTHDGITGEVEFSYDTMTDDLQSIVSAGFRYGSIQEKAGLVTVCRGTGEPVEGLVDLAGIDRLIAIMKEDFEVELFIRREVLAASGIRCTYR